MKRSPTAKDAAVAASESVEHQTVEGDGGKRNLIIQGNEFAHGLEKAAYKLNKAAQNLKDSKLVQDTSQHFSNLSHDIIQSIHNFNPIDLKNKIKKAIDDVEEHIHSLLLIDHAQEGGHQVKNAVHTLLMSLQKLEINAKFLGKTQEDIRNAINEAFKRITDALTKIDVDDAKTVNVLTDQLRRMKKSIDAIINDIDDHTRVTKTDDTEVVKALQLVSQNLHTVRNEVQSAIDNHGNLTDLKQKLSTATSRVVEELKTIVGVKENDEGTNEARHLDKMTKSVLIEGLTAAKNLAKNLEVLGKHE